MRSRFTRILALVLTMCLVMSCLTGCEELDYRKAVQYYNAGHYEKAAALFSTLGDYEDSKELLNSSNYWAAMDLMEAGNYQEALPRFLKLRTYEDSPQRATECQYQIAIQLFEQANYFDAETLFRDVGEYRLSGEYLRQINWQKLYDFILSREGQITTEVDGRTVTYSADLAQPDVVVITSAWEKDMGYLFQDSLQLEIKRDSTLASFTAASVFTMDFGSGEIGTQQTGAGTFELTTYVPGQKLVLDSFTRTGTDNLGNDLASQEVADSSMESAIASHLQIIMYDLPLRLTEAGTEAFF